MYGFKRRDRMVKDRESRVMQECSEGVESGETRRSDRAPNPVKIKVVTLGQLGLQGQATSYSFVRGCEGYMAM